MVASPSRFPSASQIRWPSPTCALTASVLRVAPSTRASFYSEPVISNTVGTFVLLHLRFNFGAMPFLYDLGMKDNFVYRAGPNKSWLCCLPNAFPREFNPREVVLLPLPYKHNDPNMTVLSV